jgi:hypothetical protein
MYDKKGNRLAIFAEHLSNGNLRFFVLTCSRKDRFKRKIAKEVYELFKKGLPLTRVEVFRKYIHNGNGECIYNERKVETTYHPEIFEMEIITDNPKRFFENYCESNYCRAYPEFMIFPFFFYMTGEEFEQTQRDLGFIEGE